MRFLKCTVDEELELFDNFTKYSGIVLSPHIRSAITKEASHHIVLITAILDRIVTMFHSVEDTIRSNQTIMEKKIVELLLSPSMLTINGYLNINPYERNDIYHLIEIGYIYFKEPSMEVVEEKVSFTSTIMKRATLQALMNADQSESI